MALLSVQKLEVSLATANGAAAAVRNISFSLASGTTLGIVGESGCGKSLTALAIMGLLPDNATARGRIELNGRNLLTLDDDAMCELRGNDIAMIFQEPMTSLNPLQTIGRQVAEPLVRHRGLTHRAAREVAVRLLDRVGIGDARQRLDHFPHQFSGGQRQRVMIAMALGCEPKFLIADEPTTALDVTIQAQILDLLSDLVEERQMALILISHNLGVIGETVDEVLVMYGGKIVEEAPTAALFSHIAHPYTQGLFAAMPTIEADPRVRLSTIPGTVPSPGQMPTGCSFADRCTLAIEACKLSEPPLKTVGRHHHAACIRLEAAPAEERP